MIQQNQNIPCPSCKTSIPFDAKQLMMGVRFQCPNCDASIGLAEESKPVVEQTIQKLETLKSGDSK